MEFPFEEDELDGIDSAALDDHGGTTRSPITAGPPAPQSSYEGAYQRDLDWLRSAEESAVGPLRSKGQWTQQTIATERAPTVLLYDKFGRKGK